jgi:hypothetical protein
MKIEHKIFEAEVKAFDDENLIVENFISTEHKDRGGDIMRAKGMKIVGKPVVLLLHGRGPMGSEPVGKPLSITIDEFKGQPGILARTQFFNDETGQRLYQKIKGGFIPNWSIGYSVDEAKDLLREGRYDGRDVTKWQLLEYSPVGVPMNPFAQTVKEFLDKNEDPKGPFEVPESHWFGVVEENESDGFQKCSTCESFLVTFTKEGEGEVGSACEKCEPEKFAELTKAIAPPFPKCAACGDTKVVKGELDGKPFEEPCPKCYAAPPAEEGGFMMQIQALRGLVDSMREFLKDYPDRLEALNKRVEQLEPLLKTLPPEPDGGDKGKEGEDNPPEPETPPRLIFKGTAQEKEEVARLEKEQRESVIAAIAAAMKPAFNAQVDKLMGRVN